MPVRQGTHSFPRIPRCVGNISRESPESLRAELAILYQLHLGDPTIALELNQGAVITRGNIPRLLNAPGDRQDPVSGRLLQPLPSLFGTLLGVSLGSNNILHFLAEQLLPVLIRHDVSFWGKDIWYPTRPSFQQGKARRPFRPVHPTPLPALGLWFPLHLHYPITPSGNAEPSSCRRVLRGASVTTDRVAKGLVESVPVVLHVQDARRGACMFLAPRLRVPSKKVDRCYRREVSQHLVVDLVGLVTTVVCVARHPKVQLDDVVPVTRHQVAEKREQRIVLVLRIVVCYQNEFPGKASIVIGVFSRPDRRHQGSSQAIGALLESVFCRVDVELLAASQVRNAEGNELKPRRGQVLHRPFREPGEAHASSVIIPEHVYGLRVVTPL